MARDGGAERPAANSRPPREQVSFRRLPAPGAIEVLHATYITQTFPRHTHEQFAIGVIERGAQRFECGRKGYAAGRGDIIVNNPGAVHTGRAFDANGWTYRMLYLAPELLGETASELAGRPRDLPDVPEPVIADPALAESILRLHRSLLAPTSQLERESRLLWSLAQLLARHAAAPTPASGDKPESGAVATMRDYLQAHHADEVTLADLSALVGLGPLRALRSFRATTGLPPHAYLTGLRIAEAKRLIAEGEPLAGAALAAGFADQSHLTRQFKRFTGLTPGQYRAGCKIVQDASR